MLRHPSVGGSEGNLCARVARKSEKPTTRAMQMKTRVGIDLLCGCARSRIATAGAFAVYARRSHKLVCAAANRRAHSCEAHAHRHLLKARIKELVASIPCSLTFIHARIVCCHPRFFCFILPVSFALTYVLRVRFCLAISSKRSNSSVMPHIPHIEGGIILQFSKLIFRVIGM